MPSTRSGVWCSLWPPVWLPRARSSSWPSRRLSGRKWPGKAPISASSVTRSSRIRIGRRMFVAAPTDESPTWRSWWRANGKTSPHRRPPQMTGTPQTRIHQRPRTVAMLGRLITKPTPQHRVLRQQQPLDRSPLHRQTAPVPTTIRRQVLHPPIKVEQAVQCGGI